MKVDHWRILRTFTRELVTEEEAELAKRYLELAVEKTTLAMIDYLLSRRFTEGCHVALRKEYLDALMRRTLWMRLP